MSERMPLTQAAIVVNTAAFWVAMAVAAVAWWPIYQNAQFIVLVVVAALAGSVLAIGGALLRWSSTVLAPATVIVFALIGVPLAVPDQALYGVLPTVDGAIDLFSGVALGWKQLLTITLPVGSYQALLVPILVLVLLGTVMGLSVALRARRGGLAVIVPLVLCVVGLAFGAREAYWPIHLSLGLLAVSLLWLMWRRWYLRRRLVRELDSSGSTAIFGLRTIVSAVVVMALAGGAAVAATTALPPLQPREVLRSSIEQPFNPLDYPSPLAGLRQYLKGATAGGTMFTVTGLPEGARIRLATLDSYDGVVYAVGSSTVTSESGSFTRVPFVYDQSAVDGEQVSLVVSIGDYSGVWLPTVGKFESVEFIGDRAADLRDAFFYNDTANTAAVIGGLEVDDGYLLEAVLPAQPAESLLETATAGSAQVPALGVPAELSSVLERYTSGIDGQGARLLAALDGLRSEGYISHGVGEDEPPSRSGHSADRITQLLTDQRMIGDAEQYAVTAAIMARALGFPSRVVFGFLPDDTGVVTGEMVTAWIEVNTAQYGWVTLDPTPPVRPIPEEEPEEPNEVSRPQSAIQPPNEERDLSENQAPVETSQEDPLSPEGWVLLLAIARVLGWSILVLAILISPFVVIIAAKLRRRQLRRKASSPLQRISGGWREFEDAVVDHGFALPRHATRSELARTVGGDETLRVATVADRAVFSPTDPSADEAASMWKSIDDLTAELDAGKTRWQRLRARVSVRSLGGRRRALRRTAALRSGAQR